MKFKETLCFMLCMLCLSCISIKAEQPNNPVTCVSEASSKDCNKNNNCESENHNSSNEEVHIFILWDKAVNDAEARRKIETDIEQHFEVLGKYMVNWKKENFEKNLKRFREEDSERINRAMKRNGTNPFLMIVVKVKNPTYEKRIFSDGSEGYVCIDMFEKKQFFRSNYLKENRYAVHASVTNQEAHHDLTLILGQSPEDFLKGHKEKYDGKIIDINNDLLGASEWKNLDEMYYALNSCLTNYVVLKPYKTETSNVDYSNIDLLCDSLKDVVHVLNAKKFIESDGLPYYKVKINGENVVLNISCTEPEYLLDTETNPNKDIKKEALNQKKFNGSYFELPNTESFYQTSMQNNYRDFLKYSQNLETLEKNYSHLQSITSQYRRYFYEKTA